MKFCIYGLFDPRTEELRYIGKAVNPTERLATHIREARSGSALHSRRWIHGLLQAGLRPEIGVIGECETNDAANDAERFWIASFRLMGANLTNRTPGGDGQSKGYVPTPQSVEKARRKLRGQKRTPEQRSRLKEAFNRPEVRTKRSEITATLMADPERRAKAKYGRTGQPMSDESKRKISEKWTPERKAAHAARQRAKPVDDRWRAQLAAALRARWDKRRCSQNA